MTTTDDFDISIFLNEEAFEPNKRAKLAKTDDTSKNQKTSSNLTSATTECKSKEVNRVSVQITSVRFMSAHRDGMNARILRPDPAGEQLTFANNAPTVALRNTHFNTAYGDPTQIFLELSYLYSHAHARTDHSTPISHTKNLNVTVQVDFRIVVQGRSVAVTRVEGIPQGATGGLSFDDATMNDLLDEGMHNQTYNLQSTNLLQNRVAEITDSIDWFVTIGGARMAAGTSGPHTVFLTFGAPGGAVQYAGGFDLTGGDQSITVSRLRFAIAAVTNRRAAVPNFSDNVEKDHVDAIFLELTQRGVDYTLGYRWSGDPNVNSTFLENAVPASPSLHHYLWLCATNDARGECHVIATAFILVCQALGVIGLFEIGFIWPWPSRTDDPPNQFPKRANDPLPPLALNENRPYAGPAQNYQPSIKGRFSVDESSRYFRTTARTAADNTLPAQVCLFVDARDNSNNFEGAARYLGRHLYAIGDVILDTEANSNLNADVYFTLHIRNAASRKVTRVHTNGKFRLVFVRTDNNAFDVTPYRDAHNADAVAYTIATVDGTANVGTFYWQA